MIAIFLFEPPPTRKENGEEYSLTVKHPVIRENGGSTPPILFWTAESYKTGTIGERLRTYK